MAKRNGPTEVYDLDIGQVAFFDSYTEFLPNKMNSDVWRGDNSIATVLTIFQNRMGADLIDRVGGKIADGSGKDAEISSNVDGVVYALQCQAPSTDNKLKQTSRQVLGQQEIPSWVWAAYNAVTRVYVGGTYRPNKRIQEHLGNSYEYEGAVFTKIFQPIKIESLKVCHGASPYTIENDETEFFENDPGTFVFQA